MVTSDTRNNIVVIVVIVAVAILVSLFVVVFSNSLLQVATHGENTINTVGKSVAGNITKSAEVNELNLNQFNKSMADIVRSNNATIGNLTNVVHSFSDANIHNGKDLKNVISNNSKLFKALLDEHHKTTILLTNISKQLNLIPVYPVPNPPKTQDCIIKTPTVCITPNGQIITNHK